MQYDPPAREEGHMACHPKVLGNQRATLLPEDLTSSLPHVLDNQLTEHRSSSPPSQTTYQARLDKAHLRYMNPDMPLNNRILGSKRKKKYFESGTFQPTGRTTTD